MIPLPPQQWAEHIFGCAELGDQRRTKRLVHVARELSAHTGASLACSCSGDLAAVEGTYRLIENEAVEPEAVAEAGFQATVLAARDSQLLLAIEDSTVLSYKHSVRTDLGDIGGPENSISKGIWAHSVMLLDADTERTIGLIDQQRWIRDDGERGKKHARKQRPYEEKESFKWRKRSSYDVFQKPYPAANLIPVTNTGGYTHESNTKTIHATESRTVAANNKPAA